MSGGYRVHAHSCSVRRSGLILVMGSEGWRYLSDGGLLVWLSLIWDQVVTPRNKSARHAMRSVAPEVACRSEMWPPPLCESRARTAPRPRLESRSTHRPIPRSLPEAVRAEGKSRYPLVGTASQSLRRRAHPAGMDICDKPGQPGPKNARIPPSWRRAMAPCCWRLPTPEEQLSAPLKASGRGRLKRWEKGGK